MAVVADNSHAREQRQPENDVEEQRAGELREHHLRIADGRRHERFVGAGGFLQREGAHRDQRRDDDQDEPEIERLVEELGDRHGRGFRVQPFEHAPEAEPEQEHHAGDDDVAGPRLEEQPQLAPDQRPVRLHQSSSSLSARVTRTKISSNECRLRESSRSFQPRSQAME